MPIYPVQFYKEGYQKLNGLTIHGEEVFYRVTQKSVMRITQFRYLKNNDITRTARSIEYPSGTFIGQCGHLLGEQNTINEENPFPELFGLLSDTLWQDKNNKFPEILRPMFNALWQDKNNKKV